MNYPVYFHYTNPLYKLPASKVLKQSLSFLFDNEGYKLLRIDYIFCSDAYLLHINQSHLNHNYYTDVITFDLSDTNCAVVGEVYISCDRVKENAKIYKTSYQNELKRVILHGALHLCGYDDKTKQKQSAMRQKEQFYLDV